MSNSILQFIIDGHFRILLFFFEGETYIFISHLRYHTNSSRLDVNLLLSLQLLYTCRLHSRLVISKTVADSGENPSNEKNSEKKTLFTSKKVINLEDFTSLSPWTFGKNWRSLIKKPLHFQIFKELPPKLDPPLLKDERQWVVQTLKIYSRFFTLFPSFP